MNTLPGEVLHALARTRVHRLVAHLEMDAVSRDAVAQQGRVARVLLKSPEIRIVVVGMARGVTWPEHKAPGRVVVRVERGRIQVRAGGAAHEFAAGMIVALEPGEPHDVHALDDSAFLLLVAGG